MLRIQVNYFTRCLDSAIANNFSKVTFIHGVGTGVLKTAMKQILKDYPNVEYRDASMKQFGYGATEVVIK
jgi:dsDNA-specific endonuclease/ATPase MutS2